MKVSSNTVTKIAHLPLKKIRDLERELGIYLGESVIFPIRHREFSERYGVYDEDGIYAGDVRTNRGSFSIDELRKAILALDAWRP